MHAQGDRAMANRCAKTKFVSKNMIEAASAMKIRKHEQKARTSNGN